MYEKAEIDNDGVEKEEVLDGNASVEDRAILKRENFKRLAKSRLAAVVKKMEVLGHLGNRGAYDYESKHVEKIIGTIEKEIEVLKAKFQFPETKEERNFSFED